MQNRKTVTSYPNAGFFGQTQPGTPKPCKFIGVIIDDDKPSVRLLLHTLLSADLGNKKRHEGTKKTTIELSKVTHIRLALAVFSGKCSAKQGFEQLCKEEERSMVRKTALGELLLEFYTRQSVPLLDQTVRAAMEAFIAKHFAPEKQASAPSYKMARL